MKLLSNDRNTYQNQKDEAKKMLPTLLDSIAIYAHATQTIRLKFNNPYSINK